MPIITISRGSYSRGKEIAERVSRKLGYECISRDILLEASEEFNIPEMKLIRAIHDAPSILERFTNGRELYISYFRKALLQHVQRDNVVYHGLGGHYFLSKIPHVFKIRIIADLEERVNEEMKRENIPADKARYIIRKDDDERRKWGLRLYGIDTWDSCLYDMVLNIKTITVAAAADIICDTLQSPIFQTTPLSRQILENMLLAAKVRAALVKILPAIDVVAEDGVVTISTTDLSSADKTDIHQKVKAQAEEIEGVKEVVLCIPGKKERLHGINPFHNI
jgi:cytidylate kinase